MAAVGGTAAAMGADQTNQMGVGHNNFPPDYSRRGVSGPLGEEKKHSRFFSAHRLDEFLRLAGF